MLLFFFRIVSKQRCSVFPCSKRLSVRFPGGFPVENVLSFNNVCLDSSAEALTSIKTHLATGVICEHV